MQYVLPILGIVVIVAGIFWAYAIMATGKRADEAADAQYRELVRRKQGR